jgi:DNA modification methylase
LESTLTIRRVPLADLHPDPANVRLHDEKNLGTIKASLARFQQVEPLVVQKSTGRLIAGHGRVAAMRELGWTEADIVEVDVDDTQAAAMAVTLNRSGELASWDLPALRKILDSLRDEFPLEDLGFDQGDIDELLSGLNEGEIVEDEVPAPPDAATTRTGDVWLLGGHRLMNGDSAFSDDVDRLLAGAEIHLLNCDPPYNVKVEPRSNNAIAAGLSSFTGTTHHQSLDLARHPQKAKATHAQLRPKDRPLENDFISDDDFARKLRAWFGNAARVLLPGRGFYIWGGYANCANYPSALIESGLYFSQSIIWDKQHPVLTRKDYMGAHEWCFYGWKEGAAHEFFGPNNATDLWEVKKLNHTAMVHLTEKPVELAARAIQYSSRKGENVLDLFGGSGSTLIACEQLDRHAYLMEIDSLYSDVIIMRWQTLTGKEAVLEATGQTFAAVRPEREVAS